MCSFRILKARFTILVLNYSSFFDALLLNLESALFHSRIDFGFFDALFLNLESALYDSGSIWGFFDAHTSASFRVLHKPGLPMSREMKENRPLHPFPSFRVSVPAKNMRYNSCYSAKTAHLGRVTLRKLCVTASKNALQLVLLCEKNALPLFL